MLYNALSMGKKTAKIAPSPWDFITLLEEGRAMAIYIHKKWVTIVRVVPEISSRTDRQTHGWLVWRLTSPFGTKIEYIWDKVRVEI